AVEAGRLFMGVVEKVVGVDAEPGRQLVERAGMGPRRAAENAANGPLVEAGGGDDIHERQPQPDHVAADIVAMEGPAGRRGGGECGSLSHRPSAWILEDWLAAVL